MPRFDDLETTNAKDPNVGGSGREPMSAVELSKDQAKKSINLSYAKSLCIDLPDNELSDIIAAKFISPDTIFHRPFLWGNQNSTDLEREFFNKESDFWDGILGKSAKPLTWDHNQDESMKANPVIGETVEWGNDEIGRWALSHLNRAHQYRKAVEALIKEGVIGTSSDTAIQYVKRVPMGKSTWLQTWPWFASALTDVPCEPRMVGTIEYFKSLGISMPNSEATVEQVRAMVQKAQRIFAFSSTFGE